MKKHLAHWLVLLVLSVFTVSIAVATVSVFAVRTSESSKTLLTTTEKTANHTHCNCGNPTCQIITHLDDGLRNYTAWGSSSKETSSLPTSSGYYYLTADITLNTCHTISEGVDLVLCLNGHVINTKDHTLNLINVDSGASLVIGDCSETVHYYRYAQYDAWTLEDTASDTEKASAWDINKLPRPSAMNQNIDGKNVLVKVYGGVLTGGGGQNNGSLANYSYGGAVYASGTFTMYSGNIIGNSADCGGGIYVSYGTTTIAGGYIAGNKAANDGNGSGGGIYTSSKLILTGRASIIHNTGITSPGGGVFFAARGTVTVEDTPTVKDNSWKNDSTVQVNNVHIFKSGKTITCGTLNESALIGVTMPNALKSGESVAVTAASSADNHAYFSSDLAYYTPYNAGEGSSQVVHLMGHTHTWNYTVSTTFSASDTITAACASACDYTKTDTSLTIIAPTSLNVDGKAHEASFYRATSFLSGALPTITYEYKSSKNATYEATTDTTAAGFYKASFTVGSGDAAKTAFVEYTVVSLSAVNYIDENGEKQTCKSYQLIDSDHMPTYLTAGWYVVSGSVSYLAKHVTVLGEVHLILKDGSSLLIVSDADYPAVYISESDQSLTIYGQTNGNGSMIANAANTIGCAGIGGNYDGSLATITINGGQITATGGCNAAGIGAKKITINDGFITATGGEHGVGIGGNASTVVINGGTIKAQGGIYAAGIGGNQSNTTITDGKINASGQNLAESIGADNSGTATALLKGGFYTNEPNSAYLETGYEIFDDGEADYPYQVSLPHTHDWSYKVVSTNAVNDTIVATCSGADRFCEQKDITLVLTPPASLDYDGANHLASFGDASSFLGGALPEIQYEYKYLPTESYASTDNLSKMGYYRAKATVGEGDAQVTASIEYVLGREPVTYIDENKQEQTCRVYTLFTKDTKTRPLSKGWYVISGDVELPAGQMINIDGAVTFILVDGASLTVTGNEGYPAIYCVGLDSSFTVYGQENNTGTLNANGGKWASGIGGGAVSRCNDIYIHGGTIRAIGGQNGAGIGSSYLGADRMTIDGGYIYAIGTGNDESIGTGYAASNVDVYLKGGYYAFEPQAAYIPSDYEVVDSGNPDYPYEIRLKEEDEPTTAAPTESPSEQHTENGEATTEEDATMISKTETAESGEEIYTSGTESSKQESSFESSSTSEKESSEDQSETEVASASEESTEEETVSEEESSSDVSSAERDPEPIEETEVADSENSLDQKQAFNPWMILPIAAVPVIFIILLIVLKKKKKAE